MAWWKLFMTMNICNITVRICETCYLKIFITILVLLSKNCWCFYEVSFRFVVFVLQMLSKTSINFFYFYIFTLPIKTSKDILVILLFQYGQTLSYVLYIMYYNLLVIIDKVKFPTFCLLSQRFLNQLLLLLL